MNTGSYRYVDVNNNGSYQQGRDVIVELNGYTPVAADWVVTTDLAGAPRVKGEGIDMGCYEWQPPTGTIIVVK